MTEDIPLEDDDTVKSDFFNPDEDDYEDDDLEDDEDDICGYECLGCGVSIADDEVCGEGDECPVCGGRCLSAIYF